MAGNGVAHGEGGSSGLECMPPPGPVTFIGLKSLQHVAVDIDAATQGQPRASTAKMLDLA